MFLSTPIKPNLPSLFAIFDLRTKRGLTTKVLKSSFGCTYFVWLGKNFDDNCGFKMFLKYIQEKVLLNHLEKYIVNLKIQFLFRHFDPVCTYGYFCTFLQISDKIIDMRTQKL